MFLRLPDKGMLAFEIGDAVGMGNGIFIENWMWGGRATGRLATPPFSLLMTPVVLIRRGVTTVPSLVPTLVYPMFVLLQYSQGWQSNPMWVALNRVWYYYLVKWLVFHEYDRSGNWDSNLQSMRSMFHYNIDRIWWEAFLAVRETFASNLLGWTNSRAVLCTFHCSYGYIGPRYG